MPNNSQIVLLDLAENRTDGLAQRLQMQGYSVIVAHDPAEGARIALADPPAAVIADLWMPSISGVQLCRLLRAEPATENVPVVLRGPESPRNRFWAERAGAAAYVITGRMGDLARALAHAVASTPPSDGFFTTFPHGGEDIRERIAAHLDAALFESVIASEVRALGSCGAFDRLFDLLSQFVSRVTPYHWLAVSTHSPSRMGLHSAPGNIVAAEREARQALAVPADAAVVAVQDDDAAGEGASGPVITRSIELGTMHIGKIALAPRAGDDAECARFVSVIARELAGPIRMAMLVEEAQRLATVDALTGLKNRRAFTAAMEHEIARAQRHSKPLALILFDVDHFKAVNDKRGHQAGDSVLAGIGNHLNSQGRRTDPAGRWGGEEFVVGLPDTDKDGAVILAARLRAGIEKMVVLDATGDRIPVTASFGIACLEPGESLASLVERADRGMYAAKADGRNRVVCMPSGKGEAQIPATPDATQTV